MGCIRRCSDTPSCLRPYFTLDDMHRTALICCWRRETRRVRNRATHAHKVVIEAWTQVAASANNASPSDGYQGSRANQATIGQRPRVSRLSSNCTPIMDTTHFPDKCYWQTVDQAQFYCNVCVKVQQPTIWTLIVRLHECVSSVWALS